MKTRMTDEERAERREADRQRSIEAVQALQTSEGWQTWLASRRHFHAYSLVISGRSCRRLVRAGRRRRRHVIDGDGESSRNSADMPLRAKESW